MPRVPRKHAKPARLITRSGLVRPCQATWSTDAPQCRKSMQLDVRLFIDNHWFIDGQVTYEPMKETFIYRCYVGRRKIDNELRKLSLMKRQWICHKKHKTLAIAWKLFMRDIGSLWICAIYRTQKVSFFHSDWTPRNKSTKCAINSVLDNVFLVEPHAKYFPAFYELHLFCSLTMTRLIVDLPPLIRKFVRALI